MRALATPSRIALTAAATVLLAITLPGCSQTRPSYVWQRCLGGSDDDVALSIQPTPDQGYVVAGGTRSKDGDVTGQHGNRDCWVVKLSANGDIQWQRCLGGSDYDAAYSIQPTPDQGYVVAGGTCSRNGDVTGQHGGVDCWVVKLSANGHIQWQRCLGGSDVDLANSIQPTPDQGYVVAGYTRSRDGDVTGQHGDRDCWVVKLHRQDNSRR
ncbi:MAG: hypothetical protein ABIK43_05135 [candidate division WOR-3 bacterium]